MSINNQRANDSLMKRKGSFTPSTLTQKYHVGSTSNGLHPLQRTSSQTEHNMTSRTQKPLSQAGSKKRPQQSSTSNQYYESMSAQRLSQYSSMQQNERIINSNAAAQN
mgnify:FL=1